MAAMLELMNETVSPVAGDLIPPKEASHGSSISRFAEAQEPASPRVCNKKSKSPCVDVLPPSDVVVS